MEAQSDRGGNGAAVDHRSMATAHGTNDDGSARMDSCDDLRKREENKPQSTTQPHDFVK